MNIHAFVGGTGVREEPWRDLQTCTRLSLCRCRPVLGGVGIVSLAWRRVGVRSGTGAALARRGSADYHAEEGEVDGEVVMEIDSKTIM